MALAVGVESTEARLLFPRASTRAQVVRRVASSLAVAVRFGDGAAIDHCQQVLVALDCPYRTTPATTGPLGRRSSTRP